MQVGWIDGVVGEGRAQPGAGALYDNFAFAGPLDHTYALRRYEAFCDELRKSPGQVANLHADIGHIRGEEETKSRLRELIRHLPENTGVLAANDNFARRVCLLALEAGRSVPEEIAILGVDAEEMISLTSPVSLSSIEPNAYRIGYEAARTVARLLENPATVQPVTLIPPKGVAVAASTDHLATSDPVIAKAVELIRLHACQNLTVEALCTHLGISRRSLERRFRKALNKSLNDQITKVRIDRASAFLEKSDLPIGEIADKCGFASIYYFSRAFKNATGLSPRAFRETGCGFGSRLLVQN